MNIGKYLVAGSLLVLAGCVTSTVDEMVFEEPTEALGDATVVILGRRHASDYETEPDFIACVAKHISRRDETITVLSELEFMNNLYPWFEPRTAPLRPTDIERDNVFLLNQPAIGQRAENAADRSGLHHRYWILASGAHGRDAAVGLHDERRRGHTRVL